MTVRLRSHPAARRPVLAAVGAMVVGAVGGVAWALVPDPAVVLPLGLALAVSLLPFYAPTDYGFDDEAVEVARAGRRERHPWSRFVAFRLVANGIVLQPARPPETTPAPRGSVGGQSPEARTLARHLRALRGSVFLPMDGDLAARAIPLVEQRLPRS